MAAIAGLMLAFSSVVGATVPAPLVSSATSDSGGSTVANGTVLKVTFNRAPVLAASYSLTLTDGSHVATLSSTAGTLSAAVSGSVVSFTVHGATSLSLSVLEILAATGVSDGSGNPWNLVASGQVDKATSCTNISGYTRVFRGSNCQIARPVPPDVYDVIPIPTADLPGPPNDNAPEVITNCQAGSTDSAYDLNTAAALGTNACGHNPNEGAIGNSNSNTLDYIPTPKLASFEEVGVIESIPGSSYVSATSVPPQLSGISVSGTKATFSYYTPVVCQATSSDRATISQFTYATPYTNLSRSGLVYASAISCPASGGATSMTVTWPAAIPVSSGVRFKYEGYGQGHFIVGATGSAFAGAREASESAYVGSSSVQGATITSFTPKSTALTSSSGGSVNASFATTNALTCSVSAGSVPSGAAALSLPSVASCNGSGAITVPANTSSTAGVTYTVTLTANGAAGTTPATSAITITVPAAAPPVPVNSGAPTITGNAVQGQTLTENHGTWSNNPISYTYHWQDCNSTGTTCTPIVNNATGPTYTLTAADVGYAIEVQETAINTGGPSTTPASSTPTALVTPPPVPVNSGAPTITGTAIQGQTLTENHGTWSNNPISYTYHWQDCNSTGTTCTPIVNNATGPTYTLTAADVGYAIEVQETAINTGGPSTTPASSTPTALVTPPPVPVNTGLPTVTGNAVQGQKLTLTLGSWSNSPTGVSDQWQDCDSTGTICTSILGATGPTYTPTSKDLGSTIEVQETATNSFGPGAAANSTPTAVVAPPPVPVNTGLPTVTGNAIQGQTLTLTPGAWSNSPTGVSDQWQDCDSTGTICTSISRRHRPDLHADLQGPRLNDRGPGNRGEHRRPLSPRQLHPDRRRHPAAGPGQHRPADGRRQRDPGPDVDPDPRCLVQQPDRRVGPVAGL